MFEKVIMLKQRKETKGDKKVLKYLKVMIVSWIHRKRHFY
jgi:hypothetical protein